MLGAAWCASGAAHAAPPTPGFPEPVVQWGVQKGETCDDIARSLYGSPKYATLVQRYNHVACKAGAPLKEGLTLILPEKPTTLPDARLKSMNPDVRARSGGAAWSPAAPGMSLYSNYNVNTLDRGRADIEFIDRTRVFLAENTLVVIYGTASQTRVSKTPPASVEVDAGEVKAGLAALRGDAVEVAIKGGGRVSAASRDTVVQRKGERTTVAVFDGKAGVTSGGKSVDVPKNFGTRFVGAAPPIPPRPLPPAPVWAAGGTGNVVLAPGGVGDIEASWTPVPGAIAYRFELSRDEGFHDLLVREEVPANVNAFRGQKLPLPPGTYWLSVRAIDKEEYLGIASEQRAIRAVDARVDDAAGKVGPKEIEVNPYGVLRLGPSTNVEMALDDGPFGPVIDQIDLRRRAPREIRLRPRGSEKVEVVPVRYTKVAAKVDVTSAPGGRSLAIRVALDGFDGVDVRTRVAPSARVRLPDGVRTVPLDAQRDGSYAGTVVLAAAIERARVDVVDDRGAVLGTTEYAPPPPPAATPPKEHIPQIGAFVPLWPISPAADVTWFAPTPHDGASVGVGTARGKDGFTFQGQVRASGSVGPLGLEAALRSGTTDAKTADAAAWLGARVRALRFGLSTVELAPSLRAGFPASSTGAPPQLEPALAVGGVAGRFTWLVDAGGRLRLKNDHGDSGVPTGQAFLLAGATMDVLSWLRLNALLDGHLVVRDTGAKNGLGGLALGVEAGGPVFGALSLRVSPWNDPDIGPFAAQLALGFRGSP
jgi:hypothetical protein